jgi:hypothetical protein
MGVLQSLKVFFKLTKAQIIANVCVLQNGRYIVDRKLLLIFIISSGYDAFVGLCVSSPYFVNVLLVFNNLSIDSFITLLGLNSPIDYSFSSGVFHLPPTIVTLPTTPTIIPFNWVPYQPIIVPQPFEYGLMSQLNPVIVDVEVNYVEIMRSLVESMNNSNDTNYSGLQVKNNFK